MFKKRATRRPRRRAAPRRAYRKGTSHTQTARVVVKSDIKALLPNTLTDIYLAGLGTTSERLRAVGSCYQDYRITNVKVKFMPVYNAMSGVPGSAYLPQLLTKVLDIQPSATITTEHYLDQLDPKVHELTQKDVTVSFRPKVDMLADANGAGANVSIIIKSSPWISTNANADIAGPWAPDGTFHFGMLALCTAGAGFTTNPINYQVEAFYEFRKPQALVSASNAGPQLARHSESAF